MLKSTIQKYIVQFTEDRFLVLFVIFLALIVNVIALWPLLSTGYIGDDYANSLTSGVLHYDNIGISDLTWSLFKNWLYGQGRFFPLAYYSYALFNTIQNLFIYKIGSLISVLLAFSLFSRFLYLLSGDRNLALLILFLPSIFVQFRIWHDPVLSYAYLVPLMFIYILISCILFVRYLEESGGWARLSGSILFFLVALLTYEVSFAYIAVFPFLAYGKMKDIKKSIIVSVPFIVCTLIVLAISVYARSIARGIDPSYTVSFSLGTYLSSLLGHVKASFPFIYYWKQLHPLDTDGIKGAILGANIPAYFSSLFTGISVSILALRIRWQGMSNLLITAVMFLVLPLCIIVLSIKHQNLPNGIGYLPVFCAYAGAMLLMVLGIVTVRQFFKKPALQIIVVSIIGVMISGLFLVNIHANKMVAESLNKSWYYPRNVLEKACKAGLMKDVPEGSRILLSSPGTGWDSYVLKYLLYQCCGKRFDTTDMTSLSTGPTKIGRASIGNLYALKHDSVSLSQGYVMIAKVKENYKPGQRIPKFVVQVDQPVVFYTLVEDRPAQMADNAVELCKHFLEKRDDSVVHYVLKNNTLLSEIKNCDTVYFNNGNPIALEPVQVRKIFSIEVIIKPFAYQGAYAAIIGNHPGYGYYEGFVIQHDGEKQNVYFFGFGNGKQWLPGVAFKIEPEKWTYLAITVDDSVITAYLDGQKVTSVDAQDVIKNSAMPLYLFDWIEQNRPFHGLIKEVRISNSTLSAADIANNWKSDSFAMLQTD